MQHKTTAPSIQIATIRYSDLKIGEVIGSGGYGVVSKAKWYGTEVAIKEFHLKMLSGNLQAFSQEATIMAQCQFPHIVKLYGIYDEPAHKGFVMEYLPKGSLRAVLDNQNEILDWDRRWYIALGIGNGLQYLHDRNIIHGDLKSHNILLDGNYCARIADFGLSKVMIDTTIDSVMYKTGTIRWCTRNIQ